MWLLLLPVACRHPIAGDGPTLLGLTVEPTAIPQVFRVSFETRTPGVGAVEFGPAGAAPTHRVDDLGGAVHELLAVGLSAGDWDLVAVAEDERGRTEAPAEAVEVPEPDGAPRPERLVQGDRSGWTITDVNINGTGTPKVAIFDEGGRIVWWYDPGNGEDVGAVDAQLTDAGTVLMAGSVPEGTNPVELGLDGGVRWQGPLQPGFAADGFMHHHTDRLADGSRAFLEKDVRAGVRGDRVVVRAPDGAVRWTWSNWEHWTPDPSVDEWSHANWLDLRDDVFYVSDQHSSTIRKMDRATGEVEWTLGAAGDFALEGSATWFAGQHRPDWDAEGRLWVYDNRGLRDRTRVVAYALDEEARTAAEAFAWDGGDAWAWFTGYWGSVDAFDDDHVLVGAGNIDTRRVMEVQLSTGELVAGFAFPPPFAFYRARHVDPVSAFRVRRLSDP